MKKTIFTIFVIILVIGCAGGPTALPLLKDGEEAVLFESFEDYAAVNPWAAVGELWDDDDSSTSINLSDVGVTEGATSLAMHYTMIRRLSLGDDAIAEATYYYDNPELKNWTGVKAVAMDFTNNTGRNLTVYMAVCSGPEWYWMDSVKKVIGNGTSQNVRFELINGTLAHIDTGWQPIGAFIDPQAVVRIAVRVQAPIDTRDTFYVDNIRLIK